MTRDTQIKVLFPFVVLCAFGLGVAADDRWADVRDAAIGRTCDHRLIGIGMTEAAVRAACPAKPNSIYRSKMSTSTYALLAWGGGERTMVTLSSDRASDVSYDGGEK